MAILSSSFVISWASSHEFNDFNLYTITLRNIVTVTPFNLPEIFGLLHDCFIIYISWMKKIKKILEERKKNVILFLNTVGGKSGELV